jgi:hypothetical protein
MKNLKRFPALLLTIFLLCMTVALGVAQSLSEAAQKEAERRKNLAQNGIEAKVIEEDDISDAAMQANVSTFSPVFSSKPASREPASKAKVQPYRNALQKYDREIRQSEEKLKSLRAKLNAERWALPKVGKISRNSDSSASEEKLKAQIQDLELKLAQLRRERLETYDAGRKAGFLPGELDGKGVMP